MFRREDEHWWYSGMRRVALAVLQQAVNGASNLTILDAGCGTGGTTARLGQFGTVYGVDLAWEALIPASSRGLSGRLARASVERLPFRDEVFDLVTSFEVLYHAGVPREMQALAEFRRVLRPDGLLLLRLPAHDWLRGQHDRLVHTRHRYSRREVGQKLARAGFSVQQLSWANCSLFPPAAAKRLLEGLAQRQDGSPSAAEPDLWQPPALVNRLLEQCLAVEAGALRRGVGLPFGLSVMALARRT